MTMPTNGHLQSIITKVFGRYRTPRVLTAGAQQIQELSRELQRLNAGTEEEFLTTGGYLQDFSGRAREISEASAATAGIIGGAELNQAISQLGQIFQQTKVLAAECEMGTEVLSEILRTLDLIQSAITGFQKIVKKLTILGTFIRVESARLLKMGADFSTLATAISQLGKDIEEKCSNIFTKSHSLSVSLSDSLANMFNIKANQRDQMLLVIDKTMLSINSLTEKQYLSADTTTHISNSYQNISRKISEIVMSLQFHDITRQQIEHVEQALQNILVLIQERAQKNGQQRQALMLAKDICQIQEAQLVIARDKLTQAVRAIIDNLKSIARDILAISQQVQELAGDANRQGNSFLVELEEYLAAVTAGLNLYGAARQDLGELMAAVVPAIGDMARFLLDIERIEIAIERIALNACIKAAHLGEEGDVLGVLAEATQSLVGETRQQTQAVAASLRSIKAAAQQLSAGQGAAGAPAEIDVDALVLNLGEVLQALSSLNENVILNLTLMDQKGKSLAADLTKAGEEITVGDYAGEAIDQVIAGIRELGGRFRGLLPEKYRLTPLSNEELAGLKAQYTMMDERLVHDRTLISPPPAAIKGMVVAGHDAGQTTVATEIKDDGDLGDNVELF